MTTAIATAAPAVNFYKVVGNSSVTNAHYFEQGEIVRVIYSEDEVVSHFGDAAKGTIGVLNLDGKLQFVPLVDLEASTIQEAMAYHGVNPDDLAADLAASGREPAESLTATVH